MGNSSQRHVVTYHPQQESGPRIKDEEYDQVYVFADDEWYRHGVYKQWYPNGQIRKLCFHKYGHVVDRCIEWTQDGTLLSVVRKLEQSVNPDGTVDHPMAQELTYHEETGTLRREFVYRLSRMISSDHILGSCVEHRIKWVDGVYREWCPEGTLLIERNYKVGKFQGMLHGREREWYKGGVPKVEAHYTDGVPDGDRREYYENGNKKLVCTLRTVRVPPSYTLTTIRVGPSAEYYETGTPKLECTYDARGRLKGTYTEYHATGEVRIVAEYRRDKVVRVLRLHDEVGRDCLLPAGEQIVWKACATDPVINKGVGVYVKIMVPQDALRVTPIDTKRNYKSRISYGVVLAIESADGTQYDRAVSFVYTKERLTYVVGERVAVDPDDFDDDPNVECGAGVNVHRHRDQCTQWFQSNR